MTLRLSDTTGFRAGLALATVLAIAALALFVGLGEDPTGIRRLVAAGILLVAGGGALVVGWRRGRKQANAAAGLIAAVEAMPHGPAPSLNGRWHTELTPVARAVDRTRRTLASRLAGLEQASAEQNAILQSMGTALLAIDHDHRLLSMNRAAADLLGLDARAVRGRLVEEVAREAELNAFVKDAVEASEPLTAEFRINTGGQRATIQAASEPLCDEQGRPAGLLVTLTDITKLRQLESLRSDFAANVSHELRTPITNIKGYVDTLVQVGVEDREQTARFLDIIRRNAQRLAAIIEDLLALSRLEQAGLRESPETKDTPVRSLVREVVGQLQSAADAKQIVVEIEVPEDLMIRVVPSLVEQAIANLVSNAITYSPAGTKVRVTGAIADGGFVEIAVRDRGPGIAPQHLARIFERFYRVDRARSRDHGGTGLGLAIVKHIALALGGRVEVESKVGVGSDFRLLLPVGTGVASSASPSTP
ncbi:MAG: PAS domain-containing protein [Phycisphaerales bacterium]|nr:PAS domain-containing protein [Phycisphaerales bacterium]